MSQTPTAAEQHKTLVEQETQALTAKARLLEQLEATNAQLTSIRAALQGAQLGFAVAQQAAAADAANDTPTSPED
ncbi:hypothetical protein E4M02_04310 [Brevundimonas sp. S30B]|uniref:hypothetical protein n=1 Tax=unclassified Brevundimonas TaxID=2622653 RepID=UPI001071794D|nr:MULTISPECIES: hypothetical protein [unclassified Brevundimonas]QBX36906.1 hypothetical protein E4M01_03505 [Brevundimonas sp. MF30-B]TFW04299.1 hypothetical protein E4M02_04310 [Brevundimonas sp. S30B]